MKEKLKQIIRESRLKFLNRSDCSRYDTFTTFCLLIPGDDDGSLFFLRIYCEVKNTEEPNNVQSLIIDDMLEIFSIEEYMEFVEMCYEKYVGQFEIIIPHWCVTFYGFNDISTIKEQNEMIEDCIYDNDWSLVRDGFGFKIVDRTM